MTGNCRGKDGLLVAKEVLIWIVQPIQNIPNHVRA